MVVLSCPIAQCNFQTADVEVIGAAAILNLHAQDHTNAAASAASNRVPKLECPRLKPNSTREDWNAFYRRWETFRIGSSIPPGGASSQLLECATEQLGNVVLRAHPSFTTMSLENALEALMSLAVIPVALGVLRAELAALKQDPDEPFRTFAARVQGKAETCEFKTTFSTKCPACQADVSGDTYYTEESIRDVLLNGIADIDIRQDALSSEGIQKKSINEIIALVESKEIARNANPVTNVLALSEYKRSARSNKQGQFIPSAAEQAKKGSCVDCKSEFNVFTKSQRGWNRRPHVRCASCWKKGQQPRQTVQSNSIAQSRNENDEFGQISAISGQTAVLDHHIFSKGEWKRAQINSHPSIELNLALEGTNNGHK